jgi:hypothetical protein
MTAFFVYLVLILMAALLAIPVKVAICIWGTLKHENGEVVAGHVASFVMCLLFTFAIISTVGISGSVKEQKAHITYHQGVEKDVKFLIGSVGKNSLTTEDKAIVNAYLINPRFVELHTQARTTIFYRRYTETLVFKININPLPIYKGTIPTCPAICPLISQ